MTAAEFEFKVAIAIPLFSKEFGCNPDHIIVDNHTFNNLDAAGKLGSRIHSFGLSYSGVALTYTVHRGHYLVLKCAQHTKTYSN